MTDLERTLVGLGRTLDYPPTPDLADTVVAAVPARISRRVLVRRSLFVAAAVAAIAILLVALPGPRAAIAELLGIGAVRVSMVEALPESATVDRPSGDVVSIEEARHAADFAALTLDRPADTVFLDRSVPGGMVTLAFDSDGDEYVLLITQLIGTTDEALVTKAVGPGTTVEAVDVAGDEGFWIAGEPHVVVLLDSDGAFREDEARLAGNTLLVLRNGVTIRLEGSFTLDEGLEIANRLR